MKVINIKNLLYCKLINNNKLLSMFVLVLNCIKEGSREIYVVKKMCLCKKMMQERVECKERKKMKYYEYVVVL